MTQTTNPFHRQEPAPQRGDDGGDLEPDELWDDAVEMTGPATPPPVDQRAGADDLAWEVAEVHGPASVCVMGLHGGAGATTLAGLLGPGAVDAGTCWPVAGGWGDPVPVLGVVVVARTHHVGIDAATRLSRHWAAGALPDSRLLGLVLVDDGPRLTASQRQAARRLARMTPHGWHLPWQETWRLAAPELPSSPLRVRRVIQAITKAATKENHQ